MVVNIENMRSKAEATGSKATIVERRAQNRNKEWINVVVSVCHHGVDKGWIRYSCRFRR